MTTATIDTIPGTVTTVLDMRRGHRAEVVAILGRTGIHHGMPAPVEPGMVVRCVDRDEEGTTLVGPDGRLIRVPRDVAAWIQVERTLCHRPRRAPWMGRYTARPRRRPAYAPC